MIDPLTEARNRPLLDIVKVNMPQGRPKYVLDPANNLFDLMDDFIKSYRAGTNPAFTDRMYRALGFVEFMKTQGYEFVTEYWLRKHDVIWNWEITLE